MSEQSQMPSNVPPPAPGPPSLAPQAPQEKKTLPLGLILGLALVLSLIVNAWLLFASDDSSGDGGSAGSAEHVSSTPDAAVEKMITDMAAGRFMAASQTCASVSLSENLDYDGFVERMNAWSPQIGWSPTAHEFWEEANELAAYARCAPMIRNLAWGLVTPEDFDIFMTMTGPDLENLNDYFDPAALSELEIVRIDSVEFQSEQLQDLYSANCASYGTDNCEDRLVLVKVQERYFAFGVSLVNYGDGWLVLIPIGGNLSLMADLPSAVPLETTPEEYEDMLARVQESAS